MTVRFLLNTMLCTATSPRQAPAWEEEKTFILVKGQGLAEQKRVGIHQLVSLVLGMDYARY